jgi:[protein-PII] uridylyltransferase
MTDLNIQIEELIEQKAPDFEIAKVIRNEIKSYLNSLDDIYSISAGKDFFVKHTKMIDQFIKVIYKYLLRKYFGSYMPMSNSIPITIIALGSYGREQLCIYSDIDIMILYDDVQGYNLTPLMEEFMTLSWDSGLKLGSRVHEIREIEDAVKTDVTIKTSILESRLIYGSKPLWFKYQNKLFNIRNFEQKAFVLEKLQEHEDRMKKYPLRMEPNIKDGYGGIRESNMLFWMANITYGVTSTRQLSGKLFSEEEYKKYRISLEYVFKVRNALHLCAKKKLDKVTFDILPDISEKMGFQETPRLTKERQCMSELFKSLHTIHGFTSVMTKKIVRRYLYKKENLPHIYERRIGESLYLINNIIYTTFSAKPKKLNAFLKELITFPNYVKNYDISYIYYASKTILPTKTNETTKALTSTLLHKENLHAIIELLYRSGLLIEILPNWKKIINQPQFDGYHKHPVDVHSSQTLYHIQRIKDPFVQKMYEKQNDHTKYLIRLAALFHDCGKGRGRDHHIVGQNLFRKFAKSLHMPEDDINKVATLVRYHNMMSKIATTEDIYSQNTILAFTGIIQTQQLLEMLFIVTYADINSVDSKYYKSSTASLLKELYLQTLPAYDNTELLEVSTRRAAKENAITNLKLFEEQSRLLQKKILKIESNQLFLKYKAEDIIKIAKRAYEVNKFDYMLFNEEHFKIRITREVPLNLGYLLGKLQFLNISSMGIYKLFDEKKFFEITFDEKLDEVDIPFAEDIINHSFDMTKTLKLKKPEIKKDEISINCDHTDELAQLKINAKDQKGLFSYIAKIFDDFNIEIHSAKIQSNKGRVNDMILISKNGDFCNKKEKIVDLLI